MMKCDIKNSIDLKRKFSFSDKFFTLYKSLTKTIFFNKSRNLKLGKNTDFLQNILYNFPKFRFFFYNIIKKYRDK